MKSAAGITQKADPPSITSQVEAGRLLLTCQGAWRTRELAAVERQLAKVAAGQRSSGLRAARLDIEQITALDTAGALFLFRLQGALKAAGLENEITGATAEQARLLDAVTENACQATESDERGAGLINVIILVGKSSLTIAKDAQLLVNFLGQTMTVLALSLLRPWRIRWRAVFRHMETTGLNALPIVGLISFLIGLVLAFQGAAQLERFGAQIFTVNIVGVGVLREMAILLTAIIVAGRSGSAFTAQIGSMQVNEEIDALRTLGLDPMEVLVLPRVLGLVLAMPFLAFYANIMGLLGGAVMTDLVLGISLSEFIIQLRQAVSLGDLFVGLVKAPPFAFLIAMVGCFEGFRVSRNAESVGHATTRAVVEGIFLVIVLDAVLSIFFQVIGI
ncbi:MAG: ABC transporter permease [Pseudomonadota bacterium]